MNAYFQESRNCIKELLVPDNTQLHSARHSRASSTSTVVAPGSPTQPIMAHTTEPIYFCSQITLPKRCSCAHVTTDSLSATESLSSLVADASLFSANYTMTLKVPTCSSSLVQLVALPREVPGSTRRDSMFGVEDDANADTEIFESKSDEFSDSYIASLPSWEDGIFEMDSEVPQKFELSSVMLPKIDIRKSALSYRQLTRPEPWAVRPMNYYNLHKAQIRAIDDDDNEFYLI
ncbi:hypothetical protein LPJ66_002834 [Kickxella alabastrina]|uniref:Uncharacterized protein n=1 Tax=Kickxella alabastrina TaxID=61397 RepID=A0ACC1IPD0_9FUNG|nr:hypothetical protein LPJ66_002834 [Kickxella alabastrina]